MGFPIPNETKHEYVTRMSREQIDRAAKPPPIQPPGLMEHTDNPIPAEPKHHVMHCETARFGLQMNDAAADKKQNLEGCECANLIGRYDASQDVIVCQISMDLVRQLEGQRFEIVLVDERTIRADGASVVPIFIRRLEKEKE